ncbi:peptidyl-alpha-hydroxyglycine alpha-amidating lyase 1-like [Dermacentor andersoni]|uniref:peptidyl-alpha-hydroxyglycine alpha-amidating lyase 1-like n=1 Tax=Dermacentor andersoni TaxID=34620 RepID=UPI0021553377|nr:peptidyl-alpha-hydroxyglycine alpha-amidating lyase 1-like [Dermacentor andersoni]
MVHSWAAVACLLLVGAAGWRAPPAHRQHSLPWEDSNWQLANRSLLGQVAGVAVDNQGQVYIFHRGPVVWDQTSFTAGHMYRHQDAVIKEPTICVVDPRSGALLQHWGQNMFYMPHSIHIDPDDNVWTTDVALHQVFRFGSSGPPLVLGRAFEPGGGRYHFCKPTGVALGPSGRIFVSDGYCNHRIAVFTRDGAHLTDIGLQERMLVPHGVTYVPTMNVVCVADRERRRVLCYWAGARGPRPGRDLGDFVLAYGEPLQRVYGIAARGHTLYGVQSLAPNQSSAFRLELEPGASPESFSPGSVPMVQPHAIALAPDGQSLYVADLDSPRKVFKFHV